MFDQTITVINKSGKVVNTSKHLVTVWKEARAAYLARKAELRASKKAGKDATRAVQMLSLSDEQLPRHEAPSKPARRSKSVTRRKESHRHRRPSLDRGFTDTMYANDVVYSHPSQAPEFSAPERPLIRRNTSPVRRNSYDEHLAYGSLPPPPPLRNTEVENEVRGKMSKLTQLLEEANCLQYTAGAMIEHLQKNPDALAAVALTLAEISAIVTKLAPSALGSMKLAFPAVAALLMSPEFLIAGGVAVGVTVVMLGGYKIIKRIQANKPAANDDDAATELREIQGELSHVDVWRRGIADVQEEMGATSPSSIVDGEFVTPHASRRLIEEGVLLPEQVLPIHPKREREKVPRKAKTVRSEATSSSKKKHHHSTHRRHSRQGDEISTSGSTKEKKKSKPVRGLHMIFRRKSTPL